jgi:hypothetical protein
MRKSGSGVKTIKPTTPNTCEQCGVSHAAGAPHNKATLQYQYWFFGKHGRWPSWKDAVAHCTPTVRAVELGRLRVLGIDVNFVSQAARPEEEPEAWMPRVLLVTCAGWRRAYPMAWMADMYSQGGRMRAAWACPYIVSPAGCDDPEFFREWLSSYLYEGDSSKPGRYGKGKKAIDVEVLNGSVFEEI